MLQAVVHVASPVVSLTCTFGNLLSNELKLKIISQSN